MRIRFGSGRRHRHLGPARPLPPWAVWILGGALVAFGLLFGGLGSHFAGKAAAAKSWPTVEGTIERCDVRSREERRDGRTTTLWSVDLTYAYTVDGTAHKCAKIQPGGMSTSSSSRGTADVEAARYPVGKKVMVHYDPADPSDACLETEGGPGPAAFIAFGVLSFLGGAAILAIKAKGLLQPAPAEEVAPPPDQPA